MEHVVLGSPQLVTTQEVVLNNRTAVFLWMDDATKQLLQPYFRFRMEGYQFSWKYRAGLWDGYINLLRRGRVAAGLFLHYRAQIERETGLRFQVEDQRQPLQFTPDFTAHVKRRIRPYQTACIESMIAASSVGGLVLNATGTGKTFLTGAFFQRLRGHAIFVVDELTLMEQARRELHTVLGETIGVIGHQEFAPQRITVSTIQSLHKHRQRVQFRQLRGTDVLVFDEVHLALNDRSFQVVTALAPKAVFGLTATLEMKKLEVQLRAIALAGPVAYSYPLAEGVREGFLAQGVVCRVVVRAAGTEGNGHRAEYRRLISHNRRRNDCIEALVREGLHRNHKVVVLVERLKHLDVLAQRFADVPHAALSGAHSNQTERLAAKDAMDRGRLNLILATRVFSKGIDIRRVDVLIDATGFRSRNAAIQRYGRGVRRAEQKQGLLYFDIADKSVAGAERNRFQSCSQSRYRALRELGVPIVDVEATKPVSMIYQQALRQLRLCKSQPLPRSA